MTSDERRREMTAMLPRDAEGRYIPLDTKVLYSTDVREHKVDTFEYSPHDGIWRVALEGRFISLYASDMHLIPPNHERPDSWEKLAYDLERYEENKVTCEYFGMTLDGTCDGCRAHSCRAHGRRCSCIALALDDVARRAKALARRDAKEAR